MLYALKDDLSTNEERSLPRLYKIEGTSSFRAS